MFPLLIGLLFRCGPPLEEASEQAPTVSSQIEAAELQNARETMVREQIAERGVRDRRTLEAMRSVPRHFFVPASFRRYAYADAPLPIGHGQTISQPYIVAFMTEALELKPADRVLEIGTGSGYQAAVLARVCSEVYSIEIVEPLATEAAARLKRLGYTSVHLRTGNGYHGWPEAAPFDAIIVTAAPDELPEVLLEQLAVGGRMVAPVGRGEQVLVRIRRTQGDYKRENLLPVRFVPMVREEAQVP
jgi:protein-L-isoaspartate(D-aspartate) O-methyltransferase